MAIHQLQARVRESARTCSLGYIARELGLDHYASRTIVRRIEALIAQRGFPKPLPTALTRSRGATMAHTTDAPTTRSTWLRAAVDTWLDNFLPPQAAQSQDAAAMAAAAADMDHAAKGLRLIAGGRR